MQIKSVVQNANALIKMKKIAGKLMPGIGYAQESLDIKEIILHVVEDFTTFMFGEMNQM